MNIGDVLTKLRRSKGMSQEELAEELDLTRQTISKWELNQSTPDVEYIVKLSDFFGVSTDYLIKGEKTENLVNTNVLDAESVSFKVRKDDTAYRWCFYLGITIAAVSLIGILALVLCSVLDPWTAILNGKMFTGLMGFLLGRKILWVFIALSVLLVGGITVAVMAIVKKTRCRK